jgi:1-acyl-sn-glycerol-3-phosphate acyltransferase
MGGSTPWSIVGRAVTAPVDVEDPTSVDPELLELLAPWVDRAARAWYRLDVRGLEHVPDGPALLVGNHNSGTTFLEAIGTGARWIRERGASDPWVGLAHDQIVGLPVLGKVLTRIGAVRAGHAPAAAAFAHGRKVAVFPGGNREAYRRYADRHRIVFSGRTGWVRLALRHQVPIVPMVYIGGQRGFFVLREGKRIARWTGARRLFRTDTWPLYLGLPWGVAFGPLFHLPLPVKCVTRFLPPYDPGLPPEAADDPEACRQVYDEVVGRMQQALSELAQERQG